MMDVGQEMATWEHGKWLADCFSKDMIADSKSTWYLQIIKVLVCGFLWTSALMTGFDSEFQLLVGDSKLALRVFLFS